MEFYDLLLQLFGLVGRKAQLADVVAAQLFRVIIPQFRLHCVRAQNCVGGKGAGQATGYYVISQLKTQIVPVPGQEDVAQTGVFKTF